MRNLARVRNIFKPDSSEPYKISRSKIELFTQCKRCFYLDRRLGIERPSGPPFTLNSAVDTLLKKEFDIHRARGSRHPLMEAYGIDAKPFAHEKMNEWRENFKGVQFYHAGSNFLVTGAVDDLWVNSAGELHIVDYKATSTEAEITLDSEYRSSYKRQMEVYQWLLRRNGFPVSSVGYFIYANGKKDKKAFDGKLEFDVQIIPYKGDDAWIDISLIEIKSVLMGSLPELGISCDFCSYRKEASRVEEERKVKKIKK